MFVGKNWQDVLTQRCTGAYGETWMSWSTGSLLVLLSKYLLEEEHVASRYWTRLAGWLQQQHHLFFSSCCCLRVLLAFELLNEYYAPSLYIYIYIIYLYLFSYNVIFICIYMYILIYITYL